MLSATFVKNVKAPGRYGDGRGGLGLGRYPVVTLAMARERALDNTRATARGHDPRRTVKSVPTFAEALKTVIAVHAASWEDRKGSEHQWRASMRNYVLPRLARKRVDAVSTADVLAVLSPIWSSKRETARRVRQRIGAVMKWAIAQGPAHGQPRRRGHPRRAAEERYGAEAPAGVAARRGRGRAATRIGACASRSSSSCSPPRARARPATRAGTRPTATTRCGPCPPSA